MGPEPEVRGAVESPLDACRSALKCGCKLAGFLGV
jgi:hypothetical protein